MISLIQLARAHALARGEVAVAVAVADEAGDLVDGEPVRDAVAQPFDDRLGVAAEGVDRRPRRASRPRSSSAWGRSQWKSVTQGVIPRASRASISR